MIAVGGCRSNVSVLDAMKIFQQSATHLALVSEEPGVLTGCIAAGVAPRNSAGIHSLPFGVILAMSADVASCRVVLVDVCSTHRNSHYRGHF
jgi:hypothetical protein